jgi:hypothetical protein
MSTTALAPAAPQKLDDVMLAMDVVDTLRHRERLVEMELGGDAREEALVKRLKEIYQAQGIEVPENILRDGVKALEEKRFHYEPPRDGFAVRLAKIYIARDRWLKPLAVLLGIGAFATAAYEFGYDAPREARLEKTRIELTETLPASLAGERDAALKLAADDESRARIETAYQDGLEATRRQDARSARTAIDDLKTLAGDLAVELTVRIISREGEYSGVFRVHDKDPNLRNYYLIVEAVDATGRPRKLEIRSEEDQATRRVEKWGVRVPEQVFQSVAADKRDDQIIQNAVIGKKEKGRLSPAYAMNGAGGAILEW